MTLKIQTANFSIFRSAFRKILWQPYELHKQVLNDKVEQIRQRLKMNELFSSAGLASQVLYHEANFFL